MATVTTFDLDNGTAGLDGTLSFTEGNGPKLLAPRAVVSATGNFNGQTLTISGLLPEDQLGFASGVTTVGDNIVINNVVIGTLAGGAGGADFVVTLNANASANRVQQL